jgi:hypothetical protein
MVLTPLLPAGHSPGIVPEAVWVLAAMIASGRVQKPSLAITGEVLLTVIVLAGVAGAEILLTLSLGIGGAEAAKLKYVSRLATEKNAPAVIVRRLKIPDWEAVFFWMVLFTGVGWDRQRKEPLSVRNRRHDWMHLS